MSVHSPSSAPARHEPVRVPRGDRKLPTYGRLIHAQGYSQGRGPGSRRHGLRDRRPPGKRRGPRVAAGHRAPEAQRGRREGRPDPGRPEIPQQAGAQGARGDQEEQTRPALLQEVPAADRDRELRGRLGQARRVRLDRRGRRRADGHQAEGVRPRGGGPHARHHRLLQHLGTLHQRDDRGPLRRVQAALPRHPLLQPRALHAVAGAGGR